MSSVATDDMSSVATEDMSSVATEDMSSVASRCAEKVQRGSNGKPIRPVNRKTGKTEKEVPRKGSI